MTEYEYEKWLLKHCPSDVDIDDFVYRLAVGTIGLIEHVHKTTKEPLKSLVARFYDKEPH
jgi:hypothetical protein